MHDERKSYGGKVIFVCHSIGNLGGHHLPGGENLKGSRSDCGGGYQKFHQAVESFEIRTPMTSYHEYNKIEKAYQLVDKMREGLNIALITDAGDAGDLGSGEDLVRICYEEGIEVTSLPGPAACIPHSRCRGSRPDGLRLRRFCREKKSGQQCSRSWSMRRARSSSTGAASSDPHAGRAV